jgi:hypothetical protein
MTPHRALTLLVLPAACLLGACGDPLVDAPEREGGNAPDPTGLLEGDVVYAAPMPECVGGAVTGRVVLTLFRSDDPPPPEGGATTAVNLLFVDAAELFAPSDCGLPEGTVVTRSAGFRWPDIPLGQGPADAEGDLPGVAYQIRGFYDAEGDFDPRFGIRSGATRGDVAGGAFLSATDLRFRALAFDHVDERPDGQVVSGVTVTLAAPVGSEIPAFALDEGTRAMSSSATFSLSPDPVARDQALWELAAMRLRLLDPDGPEGPSLERAGVDLDTSQEGRGFFVAPVDADRDGMGDLHPVLGSTGLPWLLPIVIAQRARNPVERSVGIPGVRFVATVRPGFVLPPAQRTTFAPEIDISVPPVAIVTLRPDLPECQIPYIAPGNAAEQYEAGPTECQELPTGSYDVALIGGLAGATIVDVRAAIQAEMPDIPASALDAAVAARTDTGFALSGGTLASQAWSIPNELGCPDVAYLPPGFAINQLDEDPTTPCGAPDTLMLADQGPQGRFAVVDENPDDAPDPTSTADGRGVPLCGTAPRASTGMLDSVTYVDVPEACCDGVRALCGLPLCPLVDRAPRMSGTGSVGIRELRAGDVIDGVPTCVPFHVPVSCCR